jgi:hypothetical protein
MAEKIRSTPWLYRTRDDEVYRARAGTAVICVSGAQTVLEALGCGRLPKRLRVHFQSSRLGESMLYLRGYTLSNGEVARWWYVRSPLYSGEVMSPLAWHLLPAGCRRARGHLWLEWEEPA